MAIRRWMQTLTKLWLPIVLVLQQARALEAEDRWHSILTGLPELDGQHFRDQVAEPLVQLSANAYRYPDVIDVPGWILSSRVPPVAPSKGGVHALVYEAEDFLSKKVQHSHSDARSVPGEALPAHQRQVQEENGGADGRIVLAFRGTQLTDTQDSVADVCADYLLWDGVPGRGSLPDSCADFDNDTLDYFSQAVQYTLQVLGAYPSASLLLTGHSLGAGLAILVSAKLSTYPAIPVIAFGAPGTKTPLKVRDLDLNAEKEKRVFIIADQWDEVMRTSWDQQVGMLCLYDDKLTTSCEQCFGSPAYPLEEASLRRSMTQTDMDVDSCILCFFETHYLANLIGVINKGARPVCQPHA